MRDLLKTSLLRLGPLFGVARGIEMRLNALRGKIHDPDFLSLPKSIDGGLIADIGANLGQSLISLRRLYPSSPVVAFEPNPSCHPTLRSVAGMLGGDIRVRQCGVGNATSEMAYYVPVLENKVELLQEGSFDVTVFDEPITLERIGRSFKLKTMQIPIIKLDDIDEPFSLLKIDVQGFERQVLEGARRILKDHKPAVILERDARMDEDIAKFMRSFGYVGKVLNVNIMYV